MAIRNMVIVAGLAALASGCVVAPHAYEDRGYREDYRVYRETDSYEGYYYVRVVYINGDPWYVDEYRRARPIPRHLHSHFRHSRWTRSLPPRFSNDTVVRDGYHVSRIVYINDVPHHVDEDRRARPVPTRLRSRFAYRSVVPANDRGRRVGERPEPPAYGRERERQEAPVFGRGREREEQPVFGRGRDRVEQPAFVRGRGRDEQPSYVRERERQEQREFTREREREGQEFARERERREPPQYVRERVREEEPEFVREERGRGAPPFARNDRGARGQMEVQPTRGQAGDGRRPMAQGRNKERGRIEPVSDRGRGGAARGNEQRTESASGKQKEKAKGRGRDRDKEEGEGNDERGRKHRGE